MCACAADALPSPTPPPIKLLHAARRNNMSHYAVQRSLRLIAREGRRIRRGGSIAVIETTPLAARLQPVCLCSVNSDRCIKPSVLTSTRSVPPGKRKRSAVLLDTSTKKNTNIKLVRRALLQPDDKCIFSIQPNEAINGSQLFCHTQLLL